MTTGKRDNSGRGRARVGCSGWMYDDWVGVLYEPGLAKDRWLERYGETFGTVEVNNTFYHLPDASTFDEWRERSPDGFRFALKMSRYGTHLKHLKDPGDWIGTFLERAERLGARLGPILVQLPPAWHADAERLGAFLDAAPRRHRWAVEFRNATWFTDEVYALLREHDAALVVHDLIEDHPRAATAGWVYLRFHGPDAGKAYTGSYSHQALSGAARRIERHLAAGRDVYAYFNNDVGGCAVRDARRLIGYLDGER